MANLTGKFAWVTGGNNGIGLADSSYIQGSEIMVDGGLSNLPAGAAAFRS